MREPWFEALRRLLCWIGVGHRLVPYDPNWPLMTCRYCGRQM